MSDKHNIFWDRINERAIETISAFKEHRKPEVVRYAIHITSKCNMSCKYCNEKKSNKIMDMELFKTLCNRAGTKGIIHITGGEPMLVPWLEEEIYNHRDITRIALNTNLLNLPSERTLQSIFRLKTSLDDYDRKRWNDITGGNHFSDVVNNIKEATEIVKHTSICYTATHQNVYRLSEFIKFCKENFPKLFSLSVSFFKGNNPYFALTQEDINELFVASEQMDEISKAIFLETHSVKGNYYPENIKIPCYLSMTERLYEENGDEYYCSHLYRDHVIPPGNPGKDNHCVTGCNARFNKYNQVVHRQLELV